MILLDEKQIRQHLIEHPIEKLVSIHLLRSVDSTNRYLKELPPGNAIDICCAEEQTQGRGRLGRHWHSPFAKNIYCSSRWYLSSRLSTLSALALVVSLAILKTLHELRIKNEIVIKWPNDIFWQGKKLGGVLIELTPNSQGQLNAIIGVGLNVNSPTQKTNIQSQLDRPWCSLLEITGRSFNRNTLIAHLMIQLHQHIIQFIKTGFTHFLPTWKESDYLYQQQVTVSYHAGTIKGMAKGVNTLGQLILIDNQGTTHYISSGEASLT